MNGVNDGRKFVAQFAIEPESYLRIYPEIQVAPDQKATFVMRYHEDMAIKEIAGAFGISEGTVKSRLFYTLKKLAGRLNEFDPRILQQTSSPKVR